MSESVPRWVGGYHLLNNIGAGGSGTVWRAQDSEGNIVALKLLHPALSSTEKSRKRLVREAKLVNQIKGEGVARVLDFEADDTFPFLVTELIEGPTLAEVIAQAPLDLCEAYLLSAQLADTLERIHQIGIVHRDLKPSNVILSEAGPVLIDFGIAQTEEDQRLTKAGLVCGTPGFISPELLASSTPNHQMWVEGDWWALSALLLSSLTGRPPFPGGDPGTVLSNITGHLPDTAGLRKDIQDFFRTALNPEPELRGTGENLVAFLARSATTDTGETAENTRLLEIETTPINMVEAHNPQTMPLENYQQDFQLPGQWTNALPTPDYLPVPDYLPQPVHPPLPARTAINLAFIGFLAFFPALSAYGHWWASAPTAVVIVLLASLGAGASWLQKRRYRRGKYGRYDSALTWTLAPLHLIKALFTSLPALALTAGVMTTCHFVLERTESFNDAIVTWGASFLIMAISYYLPSSRPWRHGSRLLSNALTPTRTSQAVGTVIMVTITALLLSLL